MFMNAFVQLKEIEKNSDPSFHRKSSISNVRSPIERKKSMCHPISEWSIEEKQADLSEFLHIDDLISLPPLPPIPTQSDIIAQQKDESPFNRRMSLEVHPVMIHQEHLKSDNSKTKRLLKYNSCSTLFVEETLSRSDLEDKLNWYQSTL